MGTQLIAQRPGSGVGRIVFCGRLWPDRVDEMKPTESRWHATDGDDKDDNR